MSDMTKIAEQVPGILAASAQQLRKLASVNVELEQRAENAEHELRLMKIARRMEVRGLEPNLSLEDKVAQLRGIDTQKLASFEEAVELAAGGFRLGHIQPREEENRKVASRGTGELYSPGESGRDELEDFVTNMQAFG